MEVLSGEKDWLLLAVARTALASYHSETDNHSPLLQTRHTRVYELVVALDLLLIRSLLLDHVLMSSLHSYGVLPLHLSQMMLLSDIPGDGNQKGSKVVLAIQSLGLL